jgi:CheY-like chemotaxis protein
VEDNEDSRNSLKMLLDYYGFVVLDESASVAATKQKIRDNTFDLIILDLGLPDMASGDDYALSRLIRQIQKQKGDFCCPIIVNTGHGFLARNTCSKEELLFIHGINEFFVKPNLLINRDSMFARYVPEESR